MNRMDELIATVSRIETKVDDIGPRLDKHSGQIAAHETNLNGDAETEGLNEWRRNFHKRHALISGLVPTGIIIAVELVKHKITGKW